MFLSLLIISVCGDEVLRENNGDCLLENVEYMYFELLVVIKMGVDFINWVEDGEDLNIFIYRNFYNGGGVVIGDINNDNLLDLYFIVNFIGNCFYLNKGNFVFEDIME